MNLELEPCPFCGGAPMGPTDTSYGYWAVACPDGNDCPVAPMADGQTAEEAAKAWNTRLSIERRVSKIEQVLNHMAIIKPPLGPNRMVYETKPACNSGEGE